MNSGRTQVDAGRRVERSRETAEAAREGAPAPLPTIHLVTLFKVKGGSQERTLQLAATLRGSATVHVWSSTRVADCYRDAGVRRIVPALGRFPRGGTIVFVGTSPIGVWVRASFPRRVILIHNTLNVATLQKRLRRLHGWPLPATELVFCSRKVARSTRMTGVVHLSPIDLERFRPATRPAGAQFTVGRLSRDSAIKFGPGDAALFRALGAEGIRVRLMGATCLARSLAGAPNVELLAVGAEDPADFLRSLDCFVYRTADEWPEPYGRVVAEAMASGLPVVCHRAGGYAEELVEDGRSGFVFDDDAQAAERIRLLRDDPALRARVGAEARSRIERLYGPEELERVRAFYAGPAPARRE
ncbi:MAG TPA: glycosyltransferase family 4 protein [Anaeromyxobacter sp.]|nr:glycosyltransferase family 4 protein [Anaeromyxobacter sp.]